MFGNQKLKQKIENLEEKIEEIKSELNKQVKLSKFLLNHQKEDVVAEIKKIFNNEYLITLCYELQVEYLYDNEIKNVSIELSRGYGINNFDVENVENINNTISIIKIKNYDKYKIFQLNKEISKLVEITSLVEHYDNINKKDVKTEAIDSNNRNKTENVKNKIKKTRDSALKKYYKQMNLNLNVRDFKENGTLDEIETATLLYLYDKYKNLDEIIKHIKLARGSLIKYTYIIKKLGYLIYNHGIGRVANGCLIYNN